MKINNDISNMPSNYTSLDDCMNGSWGFNISSSNIHIKMAPIDAHISDENIINNFYISYGIEVSNIKDYNTTIKAIRTVLPGIHISLSTTDTGKIVIAKRILVPSSKTEIWRYGASVFVDPACAKRIKSSVEMMQNSIKKYHWA